MKAFAIIRHSKIKAGRHLVSAGLHNVRAVRTPNADKDAAPIEILVGSKKPWRDVMNRHKLLNIAKVKSDGNVAIEVVLAASSEFWAEKGWSPGVEPSPETIAFMTKWKLAQLEYLKGRFKDHLLASVVFHQDEASPHVHALVIPAQYRTDGREKARDENGEPVKGWKLSSEKALPGPTAMKRIVTEYADEMAGFGLERGQDRAVGTVRHKPLKEWQAEQAELSDKLKEEVMNQIELTARAELEAAQTRRRANEEAARIKAKAESEAHEQLLAQDAMMKKKADDARATQLSMEQKIERIRLREEAVAAKEMDLEKKEVAIEAMKTKLERMMEAVDTVMVKVRAFADRFLNARGPMAIQAIGPAGPAAAKITSSEEVSRLATIKAFLGARGGCEL